MLSCDYGKGSESLMILTGDKNTLGEIISFLVWLVPFPVWKIQFELLGKMKNIL